MKVLKKNFELEELFPRFLTEEHAYHHSSKIICGGVILEKEIFISVLAKEEECCDRATD